MQTKLDKFKTGIVGTKNCFIFQPLSFKKSIYLLFNFIASIKINTLFEKYISTYRT